jgi:membrane protein
MATRPNASPTGTEQSTSPEVIQTLAKGARSLQAFWTKFNNDWVMNFAAGLAFNLITAIIPILIAIIGIAGLTIGRLDPQAFKDLTNGLQHILPAQVSSGNFIDLALKSLGKNAGFLLIIAILLAIFGGSRLFVTMEGYFAIIFRTRTRGLIRQNIMAIGMLLVFVVLIPLMVFASSIPALVQAVLQATPISNSLIFDLIGGIAAVFITWVLFEAIYLVVPNQRISFRNSWFGALLAAVAVYAYLLLFPFYVTHFLGGYSGVAGFVVILLFFFYYFAVILLLGAEINAFFAMGIGPTPDNLVDMVYKIAIHLPANEVAPHEQASTSNNEELKGTPSKSETSNLEAQVNESEITGENV